MKTIDKLPSKIIDLEISITLLEYLKRNYIIDNKMYNYVINKLIQKQTLENKNIDNMYINDIDNYKILT